MAVLPVGIGSQEGGYQIERSLRFNSADSAYLSRTPGTAGNRKTWTWSGWVKLGNFSSDFNLISARTGITAPLGFLRIYSATNGYTLNYGARNSSNVVIADISTNAVFRDPSAWYHIVIALDTTQATTSDRLKIYVNGVDQSLTTSTAATLNSEGAINGVYEHNIGKQAASAVYADGYLTEVNFIDGSALDPTSFGEYNTDTGVWQPKAYTGSYGTNGFYLNFSDNSGVTSTTLGADSSGNGNNWTPNNFSVTAGAGNDSLVDTPTNYGTDTGVGGEVRGNYATLNALIPSAAILSNGNLEVASTASSWASRVSTISISSGKWYCEYTPTAGAFYHVVGITTRNIPSYMGDTATSWGYYGSTGESYNNAVNSPYGSTFTVGDVVGIAFDADAGTLTFYKNNVSQGTFTSIPNGEYFFGFSVYASGTAGAVNFGQRPFAYTAPSGFKALCTQNLPEPTIKDGGDYFNTILYTGTGSSNALTGVGFQPDLVWIKERNASADHALYDAVRGVQQQLESNTTTDETTESTGLTAFGSDGFTVGSLAQVNTNNDTYVAWCWKESTTSKFDIVTYTGNGTARTISHNLGVVPNMIIVKARTTASTDQGWPVYHSANTANPETDYLLLNTTAATADLDTVWNDTAPTSSVFSVGTNALVNANNDTYVAYLFANVAGFSAFGSYTGNGSTDGPFVYTGFRPAFVMVKRTDTTSDWRLLDNTRDTYNVATKSLYPNQATAEVTADTLDFTSNGVKIRSTSLNLNASGGTYIYACFAENPFKYSLAR